MNPVKFIYNILNPKKQKLFMEYKVNFKPRYGHGKPPHTLLYKLIDENRETYSFFLKEFLQYKNIFQAIKPTDKETDENQPSWNNGFLPGLDIVGIYGMLSHFKPKNYIEIGSGNSTKVARKAINDNNLKTIITSIDPFPRANIDHLADTVIRKPLEDLKEFSVIENLEENDILFIDNSHRCLPNSDVTVCFLELLPKLRKGVIVHIHDIYLPYDYPQFMCDRFYSEQYLLASFVLANSQKYKTIFPSYFISEDKELSKIIEPLWSHSNLKNVEKHGGSYWLKIS